MLWKRCSQLYGINEVIMMNLLNLKISHKKICNTFTYLHNNTYIISFGHWKYYYRLFYAKLFYLFDIINYALIKKYSNNCWLFFLWLIFISYSFLLLVILCKERTPTCVRLEGMGSVTYLIHSFSMRRVGAPVVMVAGERRKGVIERWPDNQLGSGLIWR